MKKNILVLFALLLSLAGTAQTLKVVNNSKAAVAFQITASDKSNSCDGKYTSATTSIAPAGVLNYASPADIVWTTDLQKGTATVYSYFTGIYTDASGGCVAKSGKTGEAACGAKKSGTIDMGKCGGSGSLNISWSADNGNVTVTIN